MDNIIIIGSGYFGRNAVLKLVSAFPKTNIIVVDYNERAFEKLPDLPIKRIKQEGVSFLDEFIIQYSNSKNWIVPAVPIHLGFEWLFLILQKEYIVDRLKVPTLLNLPNQMEGARGELYSSYADFFCPSDCPEPKNYCTVTGKPRGKPLYQLLKEIKFENYASHVIRSFQLDRGVGGYPAKKLITLFDEIKNIKQPILISTACRCHGVTNALVIKGVSDCLRDNPRQKCKPVQGACLR